MTAVTKCPDCSTRFKVTDAQLEAHDGLVRCGRCRLVFNAREHLHSDEPSPQLSLPIDTETQVETTAHVLIEPVTQKVGGTSTITHGHELEKEPATPAQQVQFVEELTDEVPHDLPRKRHWVGILTATMLVLVLLAQASYFFRVELAAQLPGLKPLLTYYCSSARLHRRVCLKRPILCLSSHPNWNRIRRKAT